MKKLLPILIGIFIPLSAYCNPVDMSKCNFITNDKNEIFDLLDNDTVYEDKKAKGLLCYTDNETTLTVSLNKGVPHGDVKFFYANGQLRMESKYKKGLCEGIDKWYYENGALAKEIPLRKVK